MEKERNAVDSKTLTLKYVDLILYQNAITLDNTEWQYLTARSRNEKTASLKTKKLQSRFLWKAGLDQLSLHYLNSPADHRKLIYI